MQDILKSFFLDNASMTEQIASQMVSLVKAPCIIFLEGELGAGKTTFAKGFLRGLGYKGLIKSPTYTFVETYSVNNIMVVHADLYRLQNVIELDHIGFRDYLHDAIVLIEWASRAKEWLPKPTLTFTLQTLESGGRLLEMRGNEKSLH